MERLRRTEGAEGPEQETWPLGGSLPGNDVSAGSRRSPFGAGVHQNSFTATRKRSVKKPPSDVVDWRLGLQPLSS